MEEEDSITEESKQENEQQPDTPTKLKRKPTRKPHEYEKPKEYSKLKKIKGAFLASNKPSYCLKQGIGSFQCGGESLRSQHLKRLRRIFDKLMRQQNYVDASGVLSVLLQATGRDKSLSRNRAKYSAALRLRSYIKGETLDLRKIRNVYDLWMNKPGPLKNWSRKAWFAVRLELLLSCLQRGTTEDAYQTADWIRRQHGFDSEPISNMVVGLTYYQKWYSSIPEELQLTELDTPGTPQSEIPIGGGVHMPMDYSKENVAFGEGEGSSRAQPDSDTSIANDKELIESDGKESLDVDDPVKIETSPHPGSQSVEEDELSNNSFSDYGDLPRHSIFHMQGLPPWLCPLKLPSFHENLEDAISVHRKLHDEYYKNALKHLRVALYSTPPVNEAFHPLIQMLLLGDQVDQAFKEFENLFDSSDTVLQLRLKADLLENFVDGDHNKLCECAEDILKKDPTCSVSLGKLLRMHKCGDYETQNLVEMIALHLDATFGTCNTWNELASCILKLSQCEEDRVSICYDGSGRHNQEYLDSSNKIPEFFIRGDSGKDWRFRARWWLQRHFHQKNLMSDIASGDLKLLTYKAAVASHIYGRHNIYVLKSTECLEKEDEMELYSLLQTHILNSIGFYDVNTS